MLLLFSTCSLRYQIASPVEGWNVTIHGLDNERKEKFLNKFPKFQQKTEDVAVFLGPEEEPTFRHGSWQNDEPILHIISVSFLNTLAFLGNN